MVRYPFITQNVIVIVSLVLLAFAAIFHAVKGKPDKGVTVALLGKRVGLRTLISILIDTSLLIQASILIVQTIGVFVEAFFIEGSMLLHYLMGPLSGVVFLVMDGVLFALHPSKSELSAPRKVLLFLLPVLLVASMWLTIVIAWGGSPF